MSKFDDLKKTAEALGIGGDDTEQLSPKEQLEKLEEEKKKYLAECPFKVGDVVTQKEDEERYKFPKLGSPAIVLNVYPPFRERDETGNPLDWNTMDILVFARDKINVYSVESFRFKLFS